MTENNNVKLLKVALMILAIVSIIYGICFLIVPGIMVILSGGSPVVYAWLRWPGGLLLALGIGNLMVFQKPSKQGIWVFITALSTLLVGLAHLYSWIMKEYSGTTMFIAMPAILLLVVSLLLWWGRQRAKDIL